MFPHTYHIEVIAELSAISAQHSAKTKDKIKDSLVLAES
jgi:hypothetical protein